MSMTDQERAGMLAKGFQAMADGKQVEWFISDTVTEAFWSKDPVGQMQIGHEVLHFRILPNTITATVTIPKPLKEWPKDKATVWVDRNCSVDSVPFQYYSNGNWDVELKTGIIFATEEQAKQSHQAIREFRTGQLS